jgi:hypothetical protein
MRSLKNIAIYMITTAIVCIIVWSSPANAGGKADFTAEFSRANKAYETGKYSEAAKNYENLAASQGPGGAVYYNLGNAYFKQGDLARATLNYLRARRLMPRDVELNENLEYARSLASDEAKQPDSFPLAALMDSFKNRFSLGELALIASLALAVWTALLCAVIYMDPSPFRRLINRMGTLVLLGSLIIFGSLALGAYEDRTSPHGIIMPDRIEVHAGPGADFSTVFILHAGAEVSVTRYRNDWAKISFPGAGSGWAPAGAFEKI